MKNVLKRTGAVVLCLTFVLSMNIKGTYGIEVEQQEQALPENPGTPAVPENPDTPTVPENPDTPTVPENPDTPAVPENPDTPAVPENPDTPTVPENPDTPTVPENPDTPTVPEEPGTPAVPENPDTPTVPEEPDTPAVPENPDTPTVPENPDTVVAAEEPDTKAVPTAPVETFSFQASSVFVNNNLKSKYSVEVPIEGLPSYITPEMVVAALKCQDETGYPASVTIAQIIQESGFGAYGPNGDQGQGLSYLAYEYNNLFGIKGTGPAGSAVMSTGEQTETGEAYMTRAGFRAYNTYTECIEDRTELLKEVYSDLTYGVTDANTFAVKIGKRWATDISYGKHLIQQMEKYDLYRLDTLTLQEFNNLLGEFINPCPGAVITSPFGYREFRNSYHKGVDLGTGAANIPTYAVQAGTVIAAGWDNSTGNYIKIDHGNGLVTTYMHHQQLYVEAGQTVEKGQQIGLSGTTGDSTGNHLHFQVEKNGVAEDPIPYFQKADTQK